MALAVKNSVEVHPTSEHPSTSLSLVEDEDGSKDSTLVDENSLNERSDYVLNGDNFSEVKDDNSNLTGGLQSNLEDSRRNEHSQSQRTDKKPTLCISLSEGQRASASSLSSGSSGPEIVSTPKRSGSPTIIMDTTNPIPQMTSTPIPSGSSGTGPNLSVQPSTSGCSRPQSLLVTPKTTGRSSESLTEPTEDDVNTSFTSQTSTHTTTHESQTDLDLYDQLQVPIIGYETMEERSRFTVFKVRVQKSVDEAWYIFRRYSDFVRLNETLKQVFPHFRLALPPKKWFGDNYDRSFLEDRLLGLQAFLNNVISHRDVCNSEPLRDFLCIDDPPGPHDSLEESRAQCELLEDQVYCLRQDLQTKDSRIALLEEELSLYKAEVDNLRRALRMERTLNTHRRCSPTSHSQRSEGSITEQDEASEAEADQGACRDKPSATSSLMTSPEGASTCSWDVISDTSRDTNKTSSNVTSPTATSSTVTSSTATSSTVTSSIVMSSTVTSSTVTSPIATTVTKDTGTTKMALSTVEAIQKVTSPSVNGLTSLVNETQVPGMTSLTKETCAIGATTVSMNGDGPISKRTTDKLRSATVS